MNLLKIIEETITEVMVQEIVGEVLRRIENMPKKALVIFTGGSIGFKDGIQQIIRLNQEGWQLKILLSKSAEHVLSKKLIEKMIGDKNVEIHGESNPKKVSHYYTGVDKVIIPVLTMNTAAKAAMGISDTLVTNIMSHCLMAGIPIVAARNACDPFNEERISIGMGRGNASYIHMMSNHLTALENYGIQLVEAKELYHRAVEKKNTFLSSEQAGYLEKQTLLKKKVVTRADVVEALHRKKDIVVSSNTIITESAKDMARSRGVRILIQ
ncbi:MAG: flavoprotein [Bacillota bacterium]